MSNKEAIEGIDLINKSIRKVNHALSKLTDAMKELKETSPIMFDTIQEAIHKASKPK